MTAMEIFLLGNITFIFLAMVEYITVIHVSSEQLPSLPETLPSMGKFLQRTGQIKNKKEPRGDPVYCKPQQQKMLSADQKTGLVSHLMDVRSRVVFPTAYMVFCAIYFMYFLNLRD